MPKEATGVTYARRIAGVGSLGVPRYLVHGLASGSLIAREAKRRTPGASAWAAGKTGPKSADHAILEQAARAPDPFLVVTDDWILRRLAPHCERIELATGVASLPLGQWCVIGAEQFDSAVV